MSLFEDASLDAAWASDIDGITTPTDVVGDAVRLGLARRPRRGMSLREALAEARDLLNHARGDGAYRASLPRALELVCIHPRAEDLQFTAARLIMEDGDLRASLSAWLGVHQRYPEAIEPFRMIVRLTRRIHGLQAALAMLFERFPEPERVEGEKSLSALALGLDEVGESAKSEEALVKLTRAHPQSRLGWRHLIRLQELRGGLISAQNSAASAMKFCRDEEFVQAHGRLTQDLQVLERLGAVKPVDERLGFFDNPPPSIRAMDAIFSNLLKDRHARRWPPRRHLGSTLLVTGSLGAGGAERQLMTTAVSLNQSANAGQKIDGYEIAGPVSVTCRSLTAKRGNDFFLNTLVEAGIFVTDYGRLPPFGGEIKFSRANPFADAMKVLPSRMREGVAHLVDFLRHEAPDVVHIWQDGMVFAAGLAALMAEVPRIVLSVRTLPPIDRISRWRVELEPLYKALLSAPGVVLTTNSTAAARRYEEWLGMPVGAVPVIHNGVTRLAETPGENDEAMWRAFASRTADADFTVGAVMRLDQNKRPLDWLLVAEHLHARYPAARFVIVGDGSLSEEAQEYAHRLGIADRVLFTGLSGTVGYWLTRMDCLMLLSEFEGMPNVLIEAQLAGKPVVTTPAGGAPETVLHGRTGWVLGSAEVVDIDEAASRLYEFCTAGATRREAMSKSAQSWAEQAFSVEAMIGKTVQVFMAPYQGPMLAAR